MKISIRKNKTLFINSILYLIAFFVFVVFYIIPNIDFEGGRPWATNIFLGMINMVFEFELSFHYLFEDYIPCIVSVTLIVINLIYFIRMMVLIIGKNQKIKYSKLLFYQISFILLNICFLILDLLKGAAYKFIPYLSLYMLLPVIIYAIYNLVSTIVYINKMKKRKQ